MGLEVNMMVSYRPIGLELRFLKTLLSPLRSATAVSSSSPSSYTSFQMMKLIYFLGLAGPSLARVMLIPFRVDHQLLRFDGLHLSSYNTFLDDTALKEVMLVSVRGMRKRDVSSAGTPVVKQAVEDENRNEITLTEILSQGEPLDMDEHEKMVEEYLNAPEPFDPMRDSGLLNVTINGNAINLRTKRSASQPSHLIYENVECKKGSNGQVSTWFEIHTSYATYARSQHLGADVSVSAWGSGASVYASALDHSSFSENSITVVRVVEVDKQINADLDMQWNKDMIEKEPAKSDFGYASGGRLTVATTITVSTASSGNELQAGAEAVVSYWGVDASAKASAKKSMNEMSAKLTIKTRTFYQGDLARTIIPKADPSAMNENLSPAEAELDEAKRKVEQFLSEPCSHGYNYKTLMEEYSKIPGRPANFVIPDYRRAKGDAFGVTQKFERVVRKAELLKLKANFDEEQLEQLDRDVVDMQVAASDWLKETASKPGASRATSRTLIQRFQTEFHEKYDKDLARIHDQYDPVAKKYRSQKASNRTLVPPKNLWKCPLSRGRPTGEEEGTYCKLDNDGWYDPWAKMYWQGQGKEPKGGQEPIDLYLCPLISGAATGEMAGKLCKLDNGGFFDRKHFLEE
ncbi:hypothetical protein L249_0217 [Ophiocordyceps polyrhachis-furcata BCC 54312]|uniref:Uncharacterized protein n=1 Tax=Ophiocordyceps polyrhachis-furcata BCC 54312 TaxID=1330021 RepID=A0A367LD45_9HYPO|nr:hypothetical protein L249_0217 [Ophiocordyceps polyrhachis-furcata BCC 54312]